MSASQGKIEFTDAGFFAHAALRGVLQDEARRLLNLMLEDPFGDEIQAKSYWLPDPNPDAIIAIELTDDLRILVCWDGPDLLVIFFGSVSSTIDGKCMYQQFKFFQQGPGGNYGGPLTIIEIGVQPDIHCDCMK